MNEANVQNEKGDSNNPVQDSTSAITKQDIEEVVNTAIKELAGVDGKSLSDINTSIENITETPESDTSYSQQLDYINSSILLNMVLTGAILGALIMRYFLDHFGRRAK